jgi:hypothetical protein
MYTYVHLRSYLAQSFLEWEIFQTKVVQKIKLRILWLISFSENRAVYEVTWKNIVESEGPEMTINCNDINCTLERLEWRLYAFDRVRLDISDGIGGRSSMTFCSEKQTYTWMLS